MTTNFFLCVLTFFSCIFCEGRSPQPSTHRLRLAAAAFGLASQPVDTATENRVFLFPPLQTETLNTCSRCCALAQGEAGTRALQRQQQQPECFARRASRRCRTLCVQPLQRLTPHPLTAYCETLLFFLERGYNNLLKSAAASLQIAS